MQNGDFASIRSLTSEQIDYLFSFDIGELPKEILVHELGRAKEAGMCFIFEPHPKQHDPQKHALFDAVFTFRTDMIDGVRYFPFRIPNDWYQGEVPNPSFHERRLLALMNANKIPFIPHELYSERIRAARFFERAVPGEFHLYGRGWNAPWKTFSWPKFRLDPSLLWTFLRTRMWEHRSSFRGIPEDKILTIANYKFILAFENCDNMPGYITEKIWDAFQAGVVPIYLGAPDVTDFIPADCFIDARDFRRPDGSMDYGHLHARLVEMSEVEWEGYRARARAFLTTPTAKRFFEEGWAEELVPQLLKFLR